MIPANVTDPKYDFYLMIIDDKAYWLSLAVVGFILATVIIVGNSILLFTTYKDPRRSLRTPPSFLITNLSASDLLLGLFNVFLVALRDVYRSRLEHMPYVFVFKTIMYTVLSTTLSVSSYSIIAMSLTCYVAINKPMDYKSIVTKRRIKIFIAVLWMVSLATCVLPITNISEKTYTLIYLHTHASLPVILLTVIYANVFRALARRTRELQLGGCDSISSISLRKNRNMAVTIIIILSLFYFSYIPQYITLHLLYFCKPCQHSLTFHKIDVALSRFLFINSAVNPFVYAWRLPKYRKRFNDCWQFIRGKLRIPCKGLLNPRTQSSQTKSAWVCQRRLWRNRRVDISCTCDISSIELKKIKVTIV
ncbi:adrenocorticotropic hormone receptor-like [Orbicella faveolata]|uniref:adrenocorticotropic hormone receptor-like n=1 Tax=Orbicella faveolata TaxID=48498 RepID=UPI0009E29AAA|nr:adrenocorticotropic hormone receptor-like [Orbicella faveolata]